MIAFTLLSHLILNVCLFLPPSVILFPWTSATRRRTTSWVSTWRRGSSASRPAWLAKRCPLWWSQTSSPWSCISASSMRCLRTQCHPEVRAGITLQLLLLYCGYWTCLLLYTFHLLTEALKTELPITLRGFKALNVFSFVDLFSDNHNMSPEEKAALISSTKSPISFLSKLGQSIAISRKRNPKVSVWEQPRQNDVPTQLNCILNYVLKEMYFLPDYSHSFENTVHLRTSMQQNYLK